MNLPLPIYDVESHAWLSARAPGKGRRLFPLCPIETAIAAARNITEPLTFESENHVQKFHTQNLIYQREAYIIKTAPETAAALELLPGLENESALLEHQTQDSSPLSYNLLSIGHASPLTPAHEVANYTRPTDPTLAAFPGGENGNQLMVSRMRSTDYGWENRPNVRLVTRDMDAPMSVWNFEGSILSVKFAFRDREEDVKTNVIGVRTLNLLKTFKLLQLPRAGKKTTNYVLKEHGEFGSYEIGKKPLADFSFNPWWNKQVAIIDSSGNWSVWDVATKQRSRIKAGKLEGDIDMAPCRITYGQDLNCLYLANRNRFELTDLREAAGKNPILDTTKSRFPYKIYDVKRWGYGSTSACVLTSKDVMWLDMRMPGREIMSVKHYRSPDDQSLSCEVFTMETETTAIVHSKKTNYATGYQFGAGSAGTPLYLDNAYELRNESESQTIGMAVSPAIIKEAQGRSKRRDFNRKEEIEDNLLDNSGLYCMSILRLQIDLSVNRQLFATEDLGKVTRNRGEARRKFPDLETTETEVESDDTESYTGLQKHTKIRDFSEIYNTLFRTQDPSLLTEDAENAAVAFATKVKEVLESDRHQTILEKTPPKKLFDDLNSLYMELFGLKQLPTVLPNRNPQENYELLMNLYLNNLGNDCHPLIRIRREQLCRLIATHAFLANTTPQISAPTEDSTPLSRLARYSTTTPVDTNPVEGGTDERTKRILDGWKLGDNPDEYEWSEETEGGGLSVRFDGLAIRRRDTINRRETLNKRRESRRQSGFMRISATQVDRQATETPEASQVESSQGPGGSQAASQGGSQGSQMVTMSQPAPGRFGNRKDKKGTKRRKLGF